MNIKFFSLLKAAVVLLMLSSCNRSIHIPAEEISSPLIKKGDLTASFSPVISSYIYSNFNIAYSPIQKYGLGLSAFNNNFYNKYTFSMGRYSSLLTKMDDQDFLFKGFLTEIYGHFSIGNVKNVSPPFDFFSTDSETFDVNFRSYKIDFGFTYFYKYVQLTFRPKLTLVDVNKITVRIPFDITSINSLVENDPYSFMETTFKISLGNTRFGVFGGSNFLFGNSPDYFDRFNIFFGGRMNISELLK